MKTVLKSQTAGYKDFPRAVADYSTELKAWKAHMARVEADARDDAMDPIKKHAPYPMPHAAQLIQESVNEAGDPDFTIENDDPSKEQVLAAKKAALMQKVINLHSEAAARIIPVGKRALLSIQADDAVRADNRRIAADRDAKWTPEELRKRRTAEENEFMDRHDALQARMAAAHRAMAEMLSDIEDLTLDNIDDWKPRAFPS